jgi:hypothetical protein
LKKQEKKDGKLPVDLVKLGKIVISPVLGSDSASVRPKLRRSMQTAALTDELGLRLP